MKHEEKKSEKKDKLPPHLAGGRAKQGHGAHDVESPIVVNQGPGYHSGRMTPSPTSLGGDALPSGENGGAIGAGGDSEPAQPAQLLPQFMRSTAPVDGNE